MNALRLSCTVVAASLVLVALAHCGSGSTSNNATTDAGTPGQDGSTASDGSSPGTDSGGTLPDGGTCTTSVSATIYDSSNTITLPNVTLFASNGPLPALQHGPGTCTPIDALPGATSKTGNNGIASLSLSGPGPFTIVAQIGKWRVSAQTTAPCTNNPMKLVLGAGDMPKIAIATGQGDSLECSLHRMGLDSAVTVFHGTGGADTSPTPAAPSTSLWASGATLGAFDVALLSCEQAETAGALPQSLHDYVAAGGFAYAEHYGYSWFNVAPFANENIATWTTGPQNLTSPTNAIVSAATPFHGWLSAESALTATGGELPLLNADNNIATVGTSATALISADSSASPTPNAPLLISWTEPTTAGLGRLIYADFHIGSATGGDYGLAAGALGVPSGSIYPTGCATKALTQVEKAFLYMLYEDLGCAP